MELITLSNNQDVGSNNIAQNKNNIILKRLIEGVKFTLVYDNNSNKIKLLKGNEVASEITIDDFDFAKWINELPTGEFGNFPSLIVKDGDDIKLVNVSTEGIFTDIRSFSSFIGGAIEGGTNMFKSSIRNVSSVNVSGLEVDIVLPKSEDKIIYGTPIISKPNSSTVTLNQNNDNIYSYDIDALLAGQTVEIQIPITWNTYGTYQASTLVKIIDPQVLDYSTSDDYSTASYRVSAKSEGEETIDCPLIEVTANDIQVPVYSVSGDNAIGDRIQVVSENDIILKTNIPVTFIGHYPVSIGVNYNKISNSIPNKVVRIYVSTYGVTPNLNDGTTITHISATELKVSFDPTQSINGALIELRAGANCNPQYVYVSSKYANSGDGIKFGGSFISEVVGIENYTITSEYTRNPSEYSFIDIDTDIQYDSVDFYDRNTIIEESITLNIPSGVSRTIELVTSDKVRLTGNLGGNIISSFDSTTGKTTLEIADTATSQDNFTSERVTFNFID